MANRIMAAAMCVLVAPARAADLCAEHMWNNRVHALFHARVVEGDPDSTEMWVYGTGPAAAWFGVGIAPSGTMQDSWAMVYNDDVGAAEYLLEDAAIGYRLEAVPSEVLVKSTQVTLKKYLRPSSMHTRPPSVRYGETFSLIVACGGCVGDGTAKQSLTYHGLKSRGVKQLAWGSTPCTIPWPEDEDDGLPPWAVVLIVTAVLCLLLGSAGIAAFLYFQRKPRQQRSRPLAQPTSLADIVPFLESDDVDDDTRDRSQPSCTEQLLPNPEKPTNDESLSSIEDDWRPLPLLLKPPPPIPSALCSASSRGTSRGSFRASKFDDPALSRLRKKAHHNADVLAQAPVAAAALADHVADVVQASRGSRSAMQLPLPPGSASVVGKVHNRSFPEGATPSTERLALFTVRSAVPQQHIAAPASPLQLLHGTGTGPVPIVRPRIGEPTNSPSTLL
eukprot:TRINITY_DN7388_c0_g5_i1.p1 TRINITY_DN7388_c0_g5~~TRINITY_DN7388_c0_g5_i1.p1  ORF type:complete len:447 (+),score=38.35 TRINITY_DN7388_c0_g5_i1:61-1401(+)